MIDWRRVGCGPRFAAVGGMCGRWPRAMLPTMQPRRNACGHARRVTPRTRCKHIVRVCALFIAAREPRRTRGQPAVVWSESPATATRLNPRARLLLRPSHAHARGGRRSRVEQVVRHFLFFNHQTTFGQCHREFVATTGNKDANAYAATNGNTAFPHARNLSTRLENPSTIP